MTKTIRIILPTKWKGKVFPRPAKSLGCCHFRIGRKLTLTLIKNTLESDEEKHEAHASAYDEIFDNIKHTTMTTQPATCGESTLYMPLPNCILIIFCL